MTSQPNNSQSKPVVLSVLCLQPVGTALLSVAEKVTKQERLNIVLDTILGGVPIQDRIILPLAAGVSISFLRDPECALTVAARLLALMQSQVAEAMAIGINLGPMQLVENKSGIPNLFGDGITVAQRVMDAASNGEVLVSRSFYEAVAYLSDDHKAMFTAAGGYDNSEGRHCELFRLGNPGSKLHARLEALYSIHASNLGGISPTPLIPSDTLKNVLDTIRTWFIPFNALVTFVGLGIAGMERLIPGGSLTLIGFFVILSLAIVVAIFYVLRSLDWPKYFWVKPNLILNVLSSKTTIVLVGVVTFMFGFGVLTLSQNLPISSISTLDSSPSVSTLVPSAIENIGVSNVASPTSSQSIGEPFKIDEKVRIEKIDKPVVKNTIKTTKEPITRSAEQYADNSPAATYKKPSVQNTKCSEILMRSSLGASLTDVDREVLKTECN